MLFQRVLRGPYAPAVGDQAMIVEALRGQVHGARLLAHAGILVVGPQRAAEKRHAADLGGVPLQQVDVGRLGSLGPARRQLGMPVEAVEFVVAGHETTAWH